MTQSGRIRVLLADDHRMVREALRAVIEPHCEVVGEAADGEQALELAARTHPDVIVLDVAMPGIGGLAAAHQLRRKSPASKVLVLSQYDDDEYVVEALVEANAAGYVLKGDAAAELLAAVRAVHAGKRYLSPAIAPVVLRRLAARGGAAQASARAGRVDGLTRREREVLKLIAEGAGAKAIAARLGISPRTAQVHRENLKYKLKADSTAAMVRYAIKHKLIRVD